MKKLIALVVILFLLVVIMLVPNSGSTPKYSLVFYTGSGGSTVKTQVVNSNETVFEPKNPTRKDSVFRGWYTTSTYEEGTEFDFSIRLRESITIYAKWENLPYTISYDLGEGEWPSPEVEALYKTVFDIESLIIYVKRPNAESPKHPNGVINLFRGWRTISQSEYNDLSKEEQDLYPYIESINPREDNQIFDENNNVVLYAHYRGL